MSLTTFFIGYLIVCLFVSCFFGIVVYGINHQCKKSGIKNHY